MTFSFNLLHVFVTRSVNPVYLLERNLSSTDFKKWNGFLCGEGEALQMQMMAFLFGTISEVEKRRFTQGVQQQLVMMSDKVNQYLFKDKKVWMMHVDAELIKANYLHSLAFFQQQLEFTAINFPAFYDQEVKITDYYLRNTLPELRHKIYTLKEILLKFKVGTELTGIITKGLGDLLSQQQLSPTNAGYISGIYTEFMKYNSFSIEEVVCILIELNYNRPEFYLYVTKSVNDRLFEINGLHEQKELLLQQKDRLKSMDVQSEFGFHPKERHIKHEIVDFLNEKACYLDELLALRRIAMNDKYVSEKAFRLRMGLSVPQIALFFRMQMESGVLSKQAKQELFNFVAQHIYTEKTIFISSENLLRRSMDVEFSSALKLWDVLGEMKDWLDHNFSVSNFDRPGR